MKNHFPSKKKNSKFSSRRAKLGGNQGRYAARVPKYLTVDNLLFVIERLSLYTMVIGSIILIVLMLNPHFWTIESVFDIVYSQPLDDDDVNNNSLKKAALNSINEISETMKSAREEGLKLDVTPTFSGLVNNITSTITTATGAYTGTKLASSVSTPLGKATVVAGTVIATVASKTIIEEIGKNQLFPKTQTDSKDVVTNPPSPADTNFRFPSINEPEKFDNLSFLPNVESTESLQKVLENMLLLSELNIFFLIMLSINIIILFIDFENIKWIKNKPKLLKLFQKSKTVRKTLLMPILLLLLFNSIISYYGLSSIVLALLEYKSSNL